MANNHVVVEHETADIVFVPHMKKINNPFPFNAQECSWSCALSKLFSLLFDVCS